MKPIAFCGSSLDDLRSFPADVVREAGYQLDRVQRGMAPFDAKPMADIGSAVAELRLWDEAGTFRVIYVAKFEEQTVGGAICKELWVPAEELEEFNRNIVGKIEVIAEFK